MSYVGNTLLISGVRAKTGDFPVADAADIYVDDETRLNAIVPTAGPDAAGLSQDDKRAANAYLFKQAMDLKADASDVPTAYMDDPEMAGTASPGSGTAYARGNHVHPAETRIDSYSLPADCFPIKYQTSEPPYTGDTEATYTVNSNDELRFVAGSGIIDVWHDASGRPASIPFCSFNKTTLKFYREVSPVTIVRFGENEDPGNPDQWPSVTADSTVFVRDVSVAKKGDLDETKATKADKSKETPVTYSLPSGCLPVKYYRATTGLQYSTESVSAELLNASLIALYDTSDNQHLPIATFDAGTLKIKLPGIVTEDVVQVTFADTDPQYGQWPALVQSGGTFGVVYADDIAGLAPLASPNFSGTPTAPDPSLGSPPSQIANLKYVNSLVDTESPLVARSFTSAASGTAGNSNGSALYFKPRYLGMANGDRFKEFIVQTCSDAGSGSAKPALYARLRRFSDKAVLAHSNKVAWPGVPNTEVCFTFADSVTLPNADNHYYVDFVTVPDYNPSSDYSSLQIGLNLYNYGANNDGLYFQLKQLVPKITVHYYSWASDLVRGSRTVNDKPLSSNVVLTANDIGYAVQGGAVTVQMELEALANGKLGNTGAQALNGSLNATGSLSAVAFISPNAIGGYVSLGCEAEDAYFIFSPDGSTQHRIDIPYSSGKLALLSDIYAAVQQLAPEWSKPASGQTGTTYTKDKSLCTYNGVLYQCVKTYTTDSSSDTPPSDIYDSGHTNNHWVVKKVSELFLPITGGEVYSPTSDGALDVRNDGPDGTARIRVMNSGGSYCVGINAQGFEIADANRTYTQTLPLADGILALLSDITVKSVKLNGKPLMPDNNGAVDIPPETELAYALPAECFPITYTDISSGSPVDRTITSNTGIRFAETDYGAVILHDIAAESTGGYIGGFSTFYKSSLAWGSKDAPIVDLLYNNVAPTSQVAPVLNMAVLVRDVEMAKAGDIGNLVHTTGNEIVGGVKTFTSNVEIANDKKLYLYTSSPGLTGGMGMMLGIDSLQWIGSVPGSRYTVYFPTTDGTLALLSDAMRFSIQASYAVGDVVFYNGAFYRCTAAHTAGAWNASHFEEVIGGLSTGTPTAPTPTSGDDSTKVATTAFVKTAVAGVTPNLDYVMRVDPETGGIYYTTPDNA